MSKSMILLTGAAVCALCVLSGCQVGRVEGVSLAGGSFERGLWFDHDRRAYQPAGWGIKLDLVAGHMSRPVPRFWEKDSNPWKGDRPWFVLRLPMVGPYVSVAAGRYGAYLGFKTFLVEDRHRVPERYGRWMKEKEFPPVPGTTMVYLQPSASIRRTRLK